MYVVSENIKKASSKLLKLIIEFNGGISEVGKINKLSRQVVFSFLEYGYIPLPKVYSIARSLKVSIWALSYVKLLEVFGEQAVPFKTVVEDIKFLTKKEKNLVLSIFKKR